MLNPTGANLGGKCGFVWGGTALFCMVAAFFFLPEMKGSVKDCAKSSGGLSLTLFLLYYSRSYREIDIMFRRHIPARKFEQTQIDIHADE